MNAAWLVLEPYATDAAEGVRGDRRAALRAGVADFRRLFLEVNAANGALVLEDGDEGIALRTGEGARGLGETDSAHATRRMLRDETPARGTLEQGRVVLRRPEGGDLGGDVTDAGEILEQLREAP